MIIQSVLATMQDTTFAYISVVLFGLGKGFGALWTPTYMFLFPIDNFGFIFGFMTLSAIPILLVSTENNFIIHNL